MKNRCNRYFNGTSIIEFPFVHQVKPLRVAQAAAAIFQLPQRELLKAGCLFDTV